MNYKAVPFTARISQNDTTQQVAQQLENLINEYAQQGWEYVGFENVETQVAPDAGCFGTGIGAKPGFTTSFKIVVFKK
ncbi:MAG TPA: DUF4177 domain-containing protein [Flavobacterium sp.]|nr:DUF4177 domain-containing protein [Flavobacterium sp.]